MSVKGSLGYLHLFTGLGDQYGLSLDITTVATNHQKQDGRDKGRKERWNEGREGEREGWRRDGQTYQRLSESSEGLWHLIYDLLQPLVVQCNSNCTADKDTRFLLLLAAS